MPQNFEEEIRLRDADEGVEYQNLRQRIFDYSARKPSNSHINSLNDDDELIFVPDEETAPVGLRIKGN